MLDFTLFLTYKKNVFGLETPHLLPVECVFAGKLDLKQS